MNLMTAPLDKVSAAHSAQTMSPSQARVIAAVDAIARGELIIVTDDDDREQEGDLICAATLCTPEMMGFIVRHTSGIVCAPISDERARHLHLDPMVAQNHAPLATAFAVSVDSIHGLTTGISAAERCATVRALANPNMSSHDFVRPGHVFPLIARPGGVLMRSGHTEAAVDLCRMAALPDVGVIGELVNDDGTVMKGGQIADFAKAHKLQVLQVADLIAWRQAKETLVERVEEFSATSEIGPLRGIAYTTPFDTVRQYAFVYGDIENNSSVLARLHRADVVEDVFSGGRQLSAALKKIAEAGNGVVVYLRDDAARPGRGPLPTPEDSDSQRQQVWLDIGIGAQILRDLGVKSIRLISITEMSYAGTAGFGLDIDGVDLIS